MSATEKKTGNSEDTTHGLGVVVHDSIPALGRQRRGYLETISEGKRKKGRNKEKERRKKNISQAFTSFLTKISFSFSSYDIHFREIQRS